MGSPWLVNDMLHDSLQALREGGVIAFPSESVFALGCDPFNHDAVTKLLQLKQRPISKGFIILAADWSQVDHLVQAIPPQALARALATWPGPVTWTFPCTDEAPEWVRGDHDSIAIRISDHPICNDLCIQSGGPIISTSANLNGQAPATDERALNLIFPEGIDCVIAGSTGERTTPTPILDVITGETYRS
jgi:L-threonylcarbamoyladenylate synthase